MSNSTKPMLAILSNKKALEKADAVKEMKDLNPVIQKNKKRMDEILEKCLIQKDNFDLYPS
jgi:hypothetical protein